MTVADLDWAAYRTVVDRLGDYGDGLPVIPPDVASVEAMLADLGRPADEVLGVCPPRHHPVTIQDVAVNAVLAGCVPSYLPVVVAAVEVLLEQRSNPLGIATTTKGVAPLIVVNGPVRHDLGINTQGNLFGPGPRANATIGRAVRFVLLNLGGAVPRVLDRSVLGHAGKYTCVIGEDEEASPWEPLHVEHGYAADESVVTLMACEAPRQILTQSATDPARLLDVFAESMSCATHFTRGGAAECLVVLAPEHRAVLSRAGWSKTDIKQHLFERCWRMAGDLWELEYEPRGLAPGDCPADQQIALFGEPEDLTIVAAGGAGVVSAYCWGFADKHVLGHSGHRAVQLT